MTTNKDWIFVLDSLFLGKAKLKNDPEGWENQRVSISRSPSKFGLFRKFKSTLRFIGDGYNYVRNVYEIKGTEHEVKIEIFEYNATKDQYFLYFSGIIDLSTYVTDEDIFADVVISDTTFARKIKSRENVKVNLSRTKSIGGLELPENNQVTVQLHQRELLSVGEFTLNEADATVESFHVIDDGVGWDGFTLPIALIGEDNNVTNLSSQTNPIISTSGALFWDAAGEDSIVTLTGTVTGILKDAFVSVSGGNNVEFLFRIYTDDTRTVIGFDSPISGSQVFIPEGSTGVNFSFLIDTKLGGVPPAPNIGPDAVISLICVGTDSTQFRGFECEFTGIQFTVAQNLQFKDGTPAQGYLMFEAFQRVIQVITDKEFSFKSDYLDRIDRGAVANGPGAFETLHSSLQIRQIPSTNPSISLNDLFNSLNAQNNLGFGIEFDEVGQPFARLEKKAHFFSGEVILTIHSVSKIEKVVARDFIYSKIKVGYDKSATEEDNGLEEYNNKFEFDTIINTFENELDLVSKIRWDGYGIEKMRRLSFATNPTEDTKEDNDTFGVVVLEDGVDGNGKKKYRSAKDEAYDIVEGIFSPETAYNLDHTPGRMLRASGGLARPGLEKYLDDEISFGFAEQNEDLRSQKTGESLIIENANIDVKTLDTGLWIPEMYSFKSALTRDQFIILTRKSNGIVKVSTTSEENTTEYNYGWLVDVDQESDQQEAEWKLLRVNKASPEVNLIDPEGNTPNVPIPPVDPSPIFGVFDGSFPFVFVGEDDPETFNQILETGDDMLLETGDNLLLEEDGLPDPVMLFDGTRYGLMGYHSEFEVQNFEYEWEGTDETGVGRKFGINICEQLNPSGHQLYDDATYKYHHSVTTFQNIISSEAPYALDVNHYIKIRKFGTTFEFTVDTVTDNLTLSETITFDNTIAETLLGARWLGGAPSNLFTGKMKYCKFKELNVSGDFVSDLIDIQAANDTGLGVPNTAANAPTNSDLEWFNT